MNTQQALPPIPWDFNMIYPQLIIVAFMAGILVYNMLFNNEDDPVGAAILAFGALLTAGGYSFYFFINNTAYFAFNNMLLVDNFSMFFNVLFCLSGMLAILASDGYLEREGMNHSEYYVIILGAVLGMMVMAAASSLLTVFIGIEILSIALYILAGFNLNRSESGEAALKYLLLGGFATGFLLYGIAMIYGSTGSLDIVAIATFIKNGGKPGVMMIAGMAMLMAGFSFKASLVPFHQWAPDVYQGAPTPITGFMSTAAKAAAFAVMIRIVTLALPGLHKQWDAMLYVLCIATMFIGNITAVVQTNIKRMLAYSSIAHAGYIVIAILAGAKGIESGASAGYGSIAFYLLAYTLMNMGAFGVIAALARKGQSNDTLSAFSGLGFRRPALAAAMSVFMLSLAGIPPTVGFIGKFYIFSTAVKAGMIPLVILGVANAVISVYYYLRVIVVMYMHEPEVEIPDAPVSMFASFATVFCVAGILVLGIVPQRFIETAAKVIFASLYIP